LRVLPGHGERREMKLADEWGPLFSERVKERARGRPRAGPVARTGPKRGAGRGGKEGGEEGLGLRARMRAKRFCFFSIFLSFILKPFSNSF